MKKEEVQEKLRRFICTELLRKPDYPLAGDEPLITGGLIDSMSLVRIGVFVENTFGVYIPDTDLTVESMDTLDQMVARIMEELQR